MSRFIRTNLRNQHLQKYQRRTKILLKHLYEERDQGCNSRSQVHTVQQIRFINIILCTGEGHREVAQHLL